MKIEYISSDGIHHSEKVALEKLRTEFNSSIFSQKWQGFAGFEIHDRETRDREIDLVLLTHDRLLLIELKHWHGVITSMTDHWYLNGNDMGRSPVKVTSSKARLLASRIKRRLRSPASTVSVEYRVILSGESDFTALPSDERDLISTLDNFVKVSTPGGYSKQFRNTLGNYCPLDDLNNFRLFFRGNDFRPSVFSFQNYRIVGDPLFSHPTALYNEYRAVKRDDANYQGLLRRWDFSPLMGAADTLEERARVALREHQVLGYIREQNEELETFLPIPLSSPTRDNVTVDFCELYRLPSRQSRLTEFVNKYGTKLAAADRLAMVKVLVSHFAALHDIGVAHRDVGDHSVWLEAPTRISISGFVTAHFPESVTVGDLRETLRASNVLIPEDIKGVGDGVPSDPFRRDVFLLGVVSYYLLFLEWPPREEGINFHSWGPAKQDPFSGALDPWLRTALELLPAERFANGREMLDALNDVNCVGGTPPAIPLADFQAFECELLPTETYRIDNTLRSGRSHIYTSQEGPEQVVVKIWYGIQPDVKHPERNHKLLRFFEKARKLKEQNCELLARVVDFGVSPAGAFIVQTWLNGQSVAQEMAAESALSDRIGLCKTLVMSVQHLHRLGIEHGDINPTNIIIDDDKVRFLDAIDFSVDAGELHTPAYSPTNFEQVPVEQRDCYGIAKITQELLAPFCGHSSARVKDLISEVDRCVAGEFEVYRLDRILDALDACLQPPQAPQLPSFQVYLRRQTKLMTMHADNDCFHVGVFEDNRIDGNVVLSTFGVKQELSISLDPETLNVSKVSVRELQHSDFIWRVRKAKGVVSKISIVLVPGPSDAVSDLLQVILALPEISAALKEFRSIAPDQPDHLAISTTAPALSPRTQDIWRELISAEEETLPEAEISGPVTRDSTSDALLVPYSTDGEPFDFDPKDSIEVLQEFDGVLRKVGQLNTRETTLTTVVIEKPTRVRQQLGSVLKFRSQQDRTSFVRRRSAVERILNRECSIANLVDYFDPRTCPPPEAYGPEPSDAELDSYDIFDGARRVFSLNPQQREAFRRVWTRGPVGLLQGPPGTGKTAFIASFIHYALAKGAQNILLASQSHEAVNNAAEKIVDLAGKTHMPLQLVRFGAEGMVSDMLRPYHSDSIIEKYRDLARAELRSRLASLSSNLGLPDGFVRGWFDLDQQLGGLVKILERLKQKQRGLSDTSLEFRRLAARVNQVQETFRNVATGKFGFADAASPEGTMKSLQSELLTEFGIRSPDAVTRLQSVIAVANEWIHRLGTDRANFEEFLAKTRTLVCGTCVGLGRSQLGIAKNQYDWVIVDEAARATPSELAVAIQSGRRILLVGDHRQLPPLYKDEVIKHISLQFNWPDEDYLTRSDFQRSFESSYGANVGAMLKTQYRMVPEIGELVSECFYPEKLLPGRGPAPDWFSSAPEKLGASITWLDTSAAGQEAYEKQQRGSSSFENPFEAREIVHLLRDIARSEIFLRHLISNSAPDEKAIGVICMYADQKRLIQRQFDEQEWASQIRKLVKIDTVDSYQGKQNRIIILSPTRNNGALQEGHVSRPERVNVSVSRAMDRLIVVGAARMWRNRNSEKPLGKVLKFVETRVDGVHFSIMSVGNRQGGTR